MIERELNEDWDIFFINGNQVFVRGIDQIVQNVRVRLQFFLTEYFLDETIGMPWFEQVLIKHFNIDQIENRVKQEILATDGILNIQKFIMNFNPAERILSIAFKAETESGESGEIVINLEDIMSG